VLSVPTVDSGDVLARFLVRAREVQVSAPLLEELLPGLRAERITSGPAAPRAASGGGMVEGWGGAIVHRVVLGAEGPAPIKDLWS
jgi:Ni,Fe-hydrogenase III large subunit